eukprot:7897938-Pyramimonas_sp.AAC.1
MDPGVPRFCSVFSSLVARHRARARGRELRRTAQIAQPRRESCLRELHGDDRGRSGSGTSRAPGEESSDLCRGRGRHS